MNIDSIKEIMDGFDPAALLPDLSSIFGKVELLCRIAVMIGPVILLIMGIAYLFFAPKEANHYFGYKCYFGMGSVQAWRFTQRFAGLVLGIVGLILTGVMFFLSTGFHQMQVPDMVWRSVVCLFWQAVIAALSLESINLTAMLLFDRKGILRKQKNLPVQQAPEAPAEEEAPLMAEPEEVPEQFPTEVPERTPQDDGYQD